MAERKREDWLGDIVAWGDRLARHLYGREPDDLKRDLVLQDAVIRCLEVVGEAARQATLLDESIAELLPELRQAYWTRNRVAHGYYDLDLNVVWATATVSVPKLVAKLRSLSHKLYP